MSVLRAHRRDIHSLLQRADAIGLSRAAVKRLHWFDYFLDHGSNVSLTCRYFGISRSTFLRWAKRFDAGRPESLEEHSRCPEHVRQPETEERAIEIIRTYRTEHLTMGKELIATKLLEEHDIHLSSSTVGRIIARHAFFFGAKASHAVKRAALTQDYRADARSTPDTKTPSSASDLPGQDDALPDFTDPVFGS